MTYNLGPGEFPRDENWTCHSSEPAAVIKYSTEAECSTAKAFFMKILIGASGEYVNDRYLMPECEADSNFRFAEFCKEILKSE
jgi:hypothetical protein